MKSKLTIEALKEEARLFAERESAHREPALYGVTDGKAVGTYLEHRFQAVLGGKYDYVRGSSAKGIDFPELGVDVKVTSVRQPQSSCPFKSARQKMYGLGYSLLVFVYDKRNHRRTRTATLSIRHVIFIDSERTGDFQTTSGLLRIIENSGNEDDLMGYMTERFLPIDEIQARRLARDVIKNPPKTGYLTISNALQWRLQYARVIEQAGRVEGVDRIL